MAKEVDRKHEGEELRWEGAHRELIDELMSLTEEEAKLVIRLLTSSRI